MEEKYISSKDFRKKIKDSINKKGKELEIELKIEKSYKNNITKIYT